MPDLGALVGTTVTRLASEALIGGDITARSSALN